MLVSVVIFIVAIFVYATFVAPEYERVNRLRAEAHARQQTLDEQRAVVENAKSLLVRYQSIPRLGEIVSSALPDNEDIAGAFQQLYTVAAASGITIQQFSANAGAGIVSPGKDAKALRSVGTAQLDLFLSGTYESFKTFMEAIERNMRIMDVVNVKVQPASRTGGNIFLFNVTVKTYYQS